MHDLSARCQCGGSRFLAPREAPLCANTVFTCTSCNRRERYAKLLDGIGEEAIRRARASLERLKVSRRVPGAQAWIRPSRMA